MANPQLNNVEMKEVDEEKTEDENIEKRIQIEAEKRTKHLIEQEIIRMKQEHGWIKVQSRKQKRNSPPANTRNTRQKLMTEYKINPVNQFQLLANNADEQETHMSTQPQTQNQIKIPPIMVTAVHEYNVMVKSLNNIAKDKYTIKVNGDRIKIMPRDVENYRKIIHMLKEQEVEHHTYQLKQDKKFRVVIKNIHYNVDKTELKAAIEEKGFQVCDIYTPTSRITKKPLSMQFVNLENTPNVKNIYNIEYLLNTKVIIEPPRPTRNIPQCARCMTYGHTQKYCYRRARCVRCGQGHATKDCKKPEETPPKCALCSEQHPANYKGCRVYKEIQSRKFPPIRQKKNLNKEPTQEKKNSTGPGISYAEATASNPQQEKSQVTKETQQSDTIQRLEKIVFDLLEEMRDMRKLVLKLLEKNT